MAAVIGISAARVQDVLRDLGCETVDVANYNSPAQTVISGPEKDVVAVMPAFKEAGATVIQLRVSGAFHSRMMVGVENEFRKTVATVPIQAPRISVVANATAAPYEPNAVTETLVSQISKPVRWTETVQYLLGQDQPEFHEVGPGMVLTKLIRQIQKVAPSV